jgi:hypothetical protein
VSARGLSLLLSVAALGCRADGLAYTLSTFEVGYGMGRGELDSSRGATWGAEEEFRSVWVAFRPMAALEPPRPVYEVPTPPEEYLHFQLPVAKEPPEETPSSRGWWYRLEEVRGLLTWVGAGMASFILLLLAKLGWDRRKKDK